MTDQKAYLDPLQDWFLAENIALDRQVNQLRGEVRRLKRQLSIASGQVSARNQLIHRMQLRTNFMERQFAEQLRLQQIYVDVEGTLLMYRRNESGVFVRVSEGDEDTESEPEEGPPAEEDLNNVARRLGFESDSDGYISDELMRSLLEDDE